MISILDVSVSLWGEEEKILFCPEGVSKQCNIVYERKTLFPICPKFHTGPTAGATISKSTKTILLHPFSERNIRSYCHAVFFCRNNNFNAMSSQMLDFADKEIWVGDNFGRRCTFAVVLEASTHRPVTITNLHQCHCTKRKLCKRTQRQNTAKTVQM